MEFFLVYIREAHPIDGERPNYRVLVEQPLTNKERNSVASTCITNLDLGGMPALMDGVDDMTSQAYAAWPDRLFLVGKDGKIAYASGEGPSGFKPQELKEAILIETGMKVEEEKSNQPDSIASQDRVREIAGGPGGGNRPAGARGNGAAGRSLLMRALDADRDGEISTQELENAPAALKRLDKDDNGTLTKDELTPIVGAPAR